MMKISKADFFDMLAFSKSELKERNEDLFKRKMELLREVSQRIEEDNHIEISFVDNE